MCVFLLGTIVVLLDTHFFFCLTKVFFFTSYARLLMPLARAEKSGRVRRAKRLRVDGSRVVPGRCGEQTLWSSTNLRAEASY